MTTLAKAKDAFKKIVQKRHDSQATVDLKRIDDAPNAAAAWSATTAILTTLPPPDPVGCCTYTIDNEPPFKITLTSTECAGVPDSQFDGTGPCQ
jgi:hypothetical protein